MQRGCFAHVARPAAQPPAAYHTNRPSVCKMGKEGGRRCWGVASAQPRPCTSCRPADALDADSFPPPSPHPPAVARRRPLSRRRHVWRRERPCALKRNFLPHPHALCVRAWPLPAPVARRRPPFPPPLPSPSGRVRGCWGMGGGREHAQQIQQLGRQHFRPPTALKGPWTISCSI